LDLPVIFVQQQTRLQADRWTRRNDITSMVRATAKPRPVVFAALPGPVEIDLSRSALIIVDMQNDFLHPQGWFASLRHVDVTPLNGVVGNINRLAEQFRKQAACVIHLNWGVRADLADQPANVVDKASDCGRIPGYADCSTNGPVLVQGSWGAQSIDSIQIEATDVAVSKQRLSGFHHNELDQILRRRRLHTLFFAGVNIDRCVFATLMDACFQGYDAVLIEDACATSSPAYVAEAVIYLVRLSYGFTAKTDEILGTFESRQTIETQSGEAS
jgi:nicotinamidase-related amidase